MRVLRPREYVRAHPERYWKSRNPTVDDINSAILEQLIFDGCVEIEVCEVDHWQLIATDTDWADRIATKLGSVEQLFNDVVGQPESGPNDLRIEWFLAQLVDAVFVWSKGCVVYQKGDINPMVASFLEENCTGSTCISYKK